MDVATRLSVTGLSSAASFRPQRLTVPLYDALAAAGLLPERGIELIDGAIIEKYPEAEDGMPLEPRRYRWPRETFQELAPRGFFVGQHLELIDGTITVMSPQDASHAAHIALIQQVTQNVLPSDNYVRVQLPLSLSDFSEPEPDLAVVHGSPGDHVLHHPAGAALVVEVSRSSLDLDLGPKAELYASVGIPEYWVVDVRARQVIVSREPAADPASAFGWSYTRQIPCRAGHPFPTMLGGGMSLDPADLFIEH